MNSDFWVPFAVGVVLGIALALAAGLLVANLWKSG